MIKLRDLSATIGNYSMDPDEMRITHEGHREMVRKRIKSTGLSADQIGRKVGGANDQVFASSRAGTHVLAPWHFGPLVECRRARTIDQVPLEWCYGNGVLLDFSKTKKPGEAIYTDDLKNELQRINHTLQPLDIVLLRTGAEDYFDHDPRFPEMASGLVEESLRWLLDQGIKLIGTDAYILDIPIPKMVAELKKGNKGAFFPVHYAGREREHLQAGKLFNLQSLSQPSGFKLMMFPIKIEEGAAAWTRAVAIEGEGILTQMPTLIDLSVPIMSESMERHAVSVDRITPLEDARRLAKSYGISRNLLPTSDLFAEDLISCSSHAGTHVDAPWHYGPIVEGRPAKTIDQFPLEFCYGDAVLLDFSHKKPHDPITSLELMGELERIDYDLKPDDIVLIRTGAEDHFFDDPRFADRGSGLSGDAIIWLFGKGIRMMGTDSYTMDIPISIMSQKLKNGDRAAYFPVHKSGIIKESSHAEKLFNLKKIPKPFGFKIAMFPIKLENCSGAWTRAVAII